MKFTKIFALLCAVAVGFVSCDNGNQGVEKPDVKGNITLSADKTNVQLGESVTFTATMKDAETGEMVDVTKFVSIYDNQLNKISNPWTPEASGSYTFNATYGPESSNNITITVMAQMPEVPADPQPANLAFNHRVVLIDHTGVNCGYCPMMTESLKLLEETEWHKHYNEVTCHAGSMAGGDPGNSAAANALNKMQKPDGYPHLKINFYGTGIGNYGGQTTVNKVINEFNKCVNKEGADVGISMAVEGDSSYIYCAAQVKAKTAKEYKVVAWLLESGIYSPGQAGASKDYHKIYNYALRNISGQYSENNVAGESVGVIEKGKTHDCAFSLPITSTKWKYENMGVLVIVSARNADNKWEVVNSSYCKIGETKPYEYVSAE